eukprot:GSMAST32.ASY1.ANO1.2761.1 assembled CDS
MRILRNLCVISGVFPQRILNTSAIQKFPIRQMNSQCPSGEQLKAAKAVPYSDFTIFDKIISKEIPAEIVYETEEVLAFRDIAPVAPTHILLIPKLRQGLTQLSKATDDHVNILGRLMVSAAEVAKQEGLDKDGFRIVVNDGVMGCQSVYHLHLHLIGGRQLSWPPG